MAFCQPYNYDSYMVNDAVKLPSDTIDLLIKLGWLENDYPHLYEVDSWLHNNFGLMIEISESSFNNYKSTRHYNWSVWQTDIPSVPSNNTLRAFTRGVKVSTNMFRYQCQVDARKDAIVSAINHLHAQCDMISKTMNKITTK